MIGTLTKCQLLRSKRTSVRIKGFTDWTGVIRLKQLLVDMNHLVLLHGTFATEAEWTRDGSPLVNELQKRLHSSRMHRHGWSGRNSFAARARASCELVNLIKTIIAEDKDARIAIVAHSHGGTIALEAMDSDEVRAHISAIACLATPVLNVAPVDERNISTGVLVTFALVGVIIATLGLPPLPHGGSPQLPTGLFSGALAAGLVWLLKIKLVDRFYRLRKELKKTILRSTCYTKVISPKTAFFRFPGDEVTSLAGAVHLINAVLGALSYFPLLVLEKWFMRLAYFVVNNTERFGKNGATYVGLLLLLSLFSVPPLIAAALNVKPAAGLWVPFGIVLLYLGFGLVYILCRGFGACALSLLFGPELFFAAPELRITTESCPYGKWTVIYLDERAIELRVREDSSWSEWNKAEIGRYSHGAVYDNWYFSRALAEWLAVQMQIDVAASKDLES